MKLRTPAYAVKPGDQSGIYQCTRVQPIATDIVLYWQAFEGRPLKYETRHNKDEMLVVTRQNG